jgi:uncharacterized BrkB/YihY/UPF0761 family membrane protein
MEGIAYDKFLASYIGIIMVMVKLIAMVLTIAVLIVVKVYQDKLDKAQTFLFQALLWLILIYILAYTIGGIAEGVHYWFIK